MLTGLGWDSEIHVSRGLHVLLPVDFFPSFCWVFYVGDNRKLSLNCPAYSRISSICVVCTLVLMKCSSGIVFMQSGRHLVYMEFGSSLGVTSATLTVIEYISYEVVAESPKSYISLTSARF